MLRTKGGIWRKCDYIVWTREDHPKPRRRSVQRERCRKGGDRNYVSLLDRIPRRGVEAKCRLWLRQGREKVGSVRSRRARASKPKAPSRKESHTEHWTSCPVSNLQATSVIWLQYLEGAAAAQGRASLQVEWVCRNQGSYSEFLSEPAGHISTD